MAAIVIIVPDCEPDTITVEQVEGDGPLAKVHGPTLAFALRELPHNAITQHDVLQSVLALLPRCTLTQLHALKLTHIGEVQRAVAQRTADRAHAKVMAEMESRPPEATDALSGN